MNQYYTAIQLLRNESVIDKSSTFDNPQPKRSLLCFVRDAQHWLTGMANTKDTTEIKQGVNNQKP